MLQQDARLDELEEAMNAWDTELAAPAPVHLFHTHSANNSPRKGGVTTSSSMRSRGGTQRRHGDGLHRQYAMDAADEAQHFGSLASPPRVAPTATEDFSDDLAAYVRRPEGKHRNGAAAAPSRQYGYQEPTLFEKRRPQPRLTPLEERHLPGGWNNSTVAKLPGKRASPRALSQPVKDRARASPLVAPAVRHTTTTAPLGKPKKLPPLVPAVALPTQLRPSSDGGDVDTKGPTATVSNQANESRVSSSPAPQEDGEQVEPNSARPPPSLQAAVLRPEDIFRATLTDKWNELAELRAFRTLQAKRINTSESESQSLKEQTVALKTEAAQVEKLVVKAKARKQELGQLIAKRRTKEAQVLDLRKVHRQLKKRLDEVAEMVRRQQEAQSTVVSARLADDEGSLPPPQHTTVDRRKQIAALKLRFATLQETIQKESKTQSRKQAVADKQRSKRETELLRLQKQRAVVNAELTRRVKTENESALSHLLESHAKGMRYREREAEHKLEQEKHRQQQLQSQLAHRADDEKSLAHRMQELTSKEGSLLVYVKDAQQRLAESQTDLQKERQTLTELQKSLESHTKRLEGLTLEKRVLEEKMTNPAMIAAVQATHNDERQDIVQDTLQAKAKQAALIRDLQTSEESLVSLLNKKPRPALADASKPLAKSILDLRLRIDTKNKEIESLQGQLETAKGQAAAKKKEEAKAKKQFDAQQDATIEQLTKELSALKEQCKQSGKRNVAFETDLDLAERLVSMNNLRNKK